MGIGPHGDGALLPRCVEVAPICKLFLMPSQKKSQSPYVNISWHGPIMLTLLWQTDGPHNLRRLNLIETGGHGGEQRRLNRIQQGN